MDERFSNGHVKIVSRRAKLLIGVFNVALIGSFALNACAPMPSAIRNQKNPTGLKRTATPGAQATNPNPQEVASRLFAKLQTVSKATLATHRASILGNNGASIISHNGGNILSNNGGGIISHNGGNYASWRKHRRQYQALALRRAINLTPRDGETMTKNVFDEETNMRTVEYTSSTNELRRLVIEGGIVPRSEVIFKKITRHGNGQLMAADVSLISQDATGFFTMALDGHVSFDDAGQLLEVSGSEAELLSEDIGTIQFSRFISSQVRSEVSAVFTELDVSVDAAVSISKPPEGSPESIGEFRYRSIDGDPLYVNKEATNQSQSGRVSREYDLHDGFVMNVATTDLSNVDEAIFTGTASYQGKEIASVEMKNAPSGIVEFTVRLNESPRSPKIITYSPGDLEAEKSAKTTPGVSVETLAGQLELGLTDGVGSAARFDHPRGLALTAEGHLLVADSGNGQIRQVGPGGVVTTLDDKLQGIELLSLLDVAVDKQGIIAFSDGHANKVYQFQRSGPTLYYGNDYGFMDTQPGPWPKFAQPLSVVAGEEGRLFVADTMNHRIRMIANNIVSTLAGSGEATFTDGERASASFDRPMGLALDNQGNLIVADTGNNRIRRISPSGVVSTIAGSGRFGFKDGPVAEAQFRHPTGVAVDGQGNIYVADTFNNRIRLITRTGDVSTLAGTGEPGLQDGDGAAARFRWPCDVVVDEDSTVFVADLDNNAIRVIKRR
jgi:sugar lactone lactonase YvrE